MRDLPSHPGTSASQVPEPPPDGGPPGSRRLRIAVIALVIALVAVMVVLHVTGVVGAGTNG